MDLDNDDDATDAESVQEKEDEQHNSPEPSPVAHVKFASVVWKYFHRLEPKGNVAICKCCKRPFSCLSLSNLKKHLNKVHGFTDEAFASGNVTEDITQEFKDYKYKPREQKPRPFRSTIWNYFTVINSEEKIAECKFCESELAFNSTTNLRKHLNRKHKAAMTEVDGETFYVKDDKDESSAVWAYFKCLDKTLKIASCLICKKRLEYSNNNDLNRHIFRKHPYIDMEKNKAEPKKLMITANGDIYEIDDLVTKKEPMATDPVDDTDDWSDRVKEEDGQNESEMYLDESIFDETTYVPTPKKPKPPKILEKQEDTSLDIFGKYMVSLLKNLPKQKADELQVDIVRQIMEAQISNNDNSLKSRANNSFRNSSNSLHNSVVKKNEINIDGKICYVDNDA